MNTKDITGPVLKEARLAAGQTQDEAAREIGVTVRTWFRWETEALPTKTVSLRRALTAYVEAHGG